MWGAHPFFLIPSSRCLSWWKELCMCPSRWTVALRARQFMFMLFIHSSFTYTYLFVTLFRVLSQLQVFILRLLYATSRQHLNKGVQYGACRTVSSSEKAARLCACVWESDAEIVRSNLKNQSKRRLKLADFLARLGTRTVTSLEPC